MLSIQGDDCSGCRAGASSRRWRWTGKPGVLRSMASQRVGHDWVTEKHTSQLGELSSSRAKRFSVSQGSYKASCHLSLVLWGQRRCRDEEVRCWRKRNRYGEKHCPLWESSPSWLACPLCTFMSLPGGSDGKESACDAGDKASIPGWGRPLGEGHGNPLQYSCLENPMDRGAWQAYSPWGRKGSDTTEWLTLSHFLYFYK